MKAAYIEETGPPENIIYGDLPQPEPADNQVLVEVRAVALNPVDTYIRNGANYWELPQPFVVGCDLAGTVSAVGSGAKQFQVGDRVWGTNQGLLGRQGTFAEYCAVDECWLYPIPENVSDEAAAACSLFAAELDFLSNKFEVNWNWVKAHSTDRLNNEVDLIAREAAKI